MSSHGRVYRSVCFRQRQTEGITARVDGVINERKVKIRGGVSVGRKERKRPEKGR